MDKVINVRVYGSYMDLDSRKAGPQHEANATVLRMGFDTSWDGLAKTVTFWDAKGRNPTKVMLTADKLEDITVSERVYLAPIPGEAMAESGEMNFTIDGYVEGKRQRSFNAWLEVEESPFAPDAGEGADPTPGQAEQIQSQIEALMEDVGKAIAAEEGAKEAQLAAETARDDARIAWTVAESAMTGAQSAQSAAETAQEAAETARDVAIATKEEVYQATAEGVAAVQQTAKSAQTEIGEQVEQAKYWSEQAQAAAGGGVTTFNGRAGVVVPRAGDYTAEMVGAATPAQVQAASDAASAAQNTANSAASAASTHAGNANNPHGVTVGQIGAAAAGHNHAYEVINPVAVELTTGAGAGHGGYIDFHFDGSTADHTSRIIEEASGAIRMDASNGVKVGASTVAGLRLRNISVGTNELTEGAAAAGYSEGDIHIVV